MADQSHSTTQPEPVEERRAAILAPLAAEPRCSRAAARLAGDALGLSERQVFNLVRRLRSYRGGTGVLLVHDVSIRNGFSPGRGTVGAGPNFCVQSVLCFD
jgi:hypothetical protein